MKSESKCDEVSGKWNIHGHPKEDTLAKVAGVEGGQGVMGNKVTASTFYGMGRGVELTQSTPGGH